MNNEKEEAELKTTEEDVKVNSAEERKVKKTKKENNDLKKEKDFFTTPLVYVGPTFPDKTITKGQVFKGGLPTYLKTIIEEDPIFKNLFIDVKQLAEFNVKVNLKGTKEFYLYQNALKKIKE